MIDKDLIIQLQKEQIHQQKGSRGMLESTIDDRNTLIREQYKIVLLLEARV